MNYQNLNKEENTNFVRLAGKVSEQPKFSHEIDGEKFYEFKVDVERLSKIVDCIPVTISERTLFGCAINEGDFVDMTGEYRSYNKLQNEKSKLILNFFAKDFKVLVAEGEYVNEIKLTGFICKAPVYRKTPFEREICDVLLAVNRANYHKSDYIPCILWGRNARFISGQNIGCKVELSGRIQSREYTKAMPNGDVIKNTAYEVSCQSVSILSNVAKLNPKVEEEKDAAGIN